MLCGTYKMGRTVHNIKEHNRIKMSVIVLNVGPIRTPLIDQNMCVGTLIQLKIICVKS